MTVGNLKQACLSAVVELKFVRRNKMRIPSTRRMLCTLDGKLLNSDLGKEILNFKSPRFSPPYNAESKGLVVVWDIIMQDWRAIPADSCVVVTMIKTQPRQEKNFWEYYNKVLSKMNANQKKTFMDK
jgi:hypothetical protein